MTNRQCPQHALARRVLGALLLIFAPACARDYRYRPAEVDLASMEGLPAARYLLPLERPAGELRVASFGAYDLHPEAGGLPFSTMHARLVMVNESQSDPWTLDVRDLVIIVRGEGRSPPVYANAQSSALPVVEVPRGGREIIDVYFPVPELPRRALPAGFELEWTVAVGPESLAGRTSFERLARKPRGADPVMAVLGNGGFWWHDPYYPRVGVFAHQGRYFASIPPQPHELRVAARSRRPPAPRK